MTLILQGFFGFAPIKALIHRLQNKIARLKVAWVAGKQWLNYLTTLLLCTYIQQELPRAKASFQPAWPPASVPVTSFHSLLSVLHTTTNYSLSNNYHYYHHHHTKQNTPTSHLSRKFSLVIFESIISSLFDNFFFYFFSLILQRSFLFHHQNV